MTKRAGIGRRHVPSRSPSQGRCRSSHRSPAGQGATRLRLLSGLIVARPASLEEGDVHHSTRGGPYDAHDPSTPCRRAQRRARRRADPRASRLGQLGRARLASPGGEPRSRGDGRAALATGCGVPRQLHERRQHKPVPQTADPRCVCYTQGEKAARTRGSRAPLSFLRT